VNRDRYFDVFTLYVIVASLDQIYRVVSGLVSDERTDSLCYKLTIFIAD